MSRSWKATYVALSQIDGGLDSASLRRHLTDPQTVSILVHAFAPFPAPTPQSKSSFETKTSAINVTPSAHSRFDIEQIKEDTLWLSKETNTNEVSALRIALLEWQTRSAVLLLQHNGDAQIASRNSGAGAGSFGASIFDPGSSILARSTSKGNETAAEFEEIGERHKRLLETYLSERRCILKCSEFMTFIALCKSDSPDDQEQNSSNWLREIGAEVLSAWNFNHPSKSSQKHPIISAVDTLRSRLEVMAQGSGWLQGEDPQEDIELAWLRSQILEMIHVMQITLNLVEASSGLVESPAVLAWFRLMKESNFYESVQPVSL